MPQQKCENCRFFSQNSSDSKRPYDGNCLRYPPQLRSSDYGIGPQPEFHFPRVSQGMHCGEWKPILDSGSISAYDEG